MSLPCWCRAKYVIAVCITISSLVGLPSLLIHLSDIFNNVISQISGTSPTSLPAPLRNFANVERMYASFDENNKLDIWLCTYIPTSVMALLMFHFLLFIF